MEIVRKIKKIDEVFFWNEEQTKFVENNQFWNSESRSYESNPNYPIEDSNLYEVEIKFKLQDITYSSTWLGNVNMICYIVDVDTELQYKITKKYIDTIIKFINISLERNNGYPVMLAKTTAKGNLIPIELI